MQTAHGAALKAEKMLSRAIERAERNLELTQMPDAFPKGLSPGEIVARSLDQPDYWTIRTKARAVHADLRQTEAEARAILSEATKFGEKLTAIAHYIEHGGAMPDLDPALAFATATVRRAVEAGRTKSPAPQLYRKAGAGLSVLARSGQALDRIRSAANIAIMKQSAALYSRAFRCQAFDATERREFAKRAEKCRSAAEAMRVAHRTRFYSTEGNRHV